MKRIFTRLMSLAACCILCLTMASTAFATNLRASDYFSFTDTWITATGGGKILVEFDVNATHTMDKVGAEEIMIYEQQSDGKYEHVKSFTSGLLETNSAFGGGGVTYQGTPGVKYYAITFFYAEDSKGNEGLVSKTNTVTA